MKNDSGYRYVRLRLIEVATLMPLILYSLHATGQTDSIQQKDVGDLIEQLLKHKNSDHLPPPTKKLIISVIPSVGYTLTTGFAADLPANGAFYTNANHQENLSVVNADLSYDIKSQKIFVSRAEIWTDHNNYKFTWDIRWEEFPESTYGIGTFTRPVQADPLLFNYFKAYFNAYKQIITGIPLYIGLGYNLDHHYHIQETAISTATTKDFQRYGFQPVSTSAGFNLNFLYDTRSSAINPRHGGYANLTFTQNMRQLGSNSSWPSLQLDVRRYLQLSPKSGNVLALWAYAWFTRGSPPYLDLPFTGGDTFNNSGRGYIQGRFTGRNMLYLESEYRFGILKNGLVGGVVFLNTESLTEYKSNAFEHIAPAGGTGLRVKLNKNSSTNVSIDYGLGLYGSHGFFVNLGEVF